MTDAEIVAHLPKIEKYRHAILTKKAEVQRIADELEDLRTLIGELEQVSEVFEGVPIHVWEMSKEQIAVRHRASGRSGDVYLNAHNGKTFGMHLKWKDKPDRWMGADWPSRKEALLAVKRFCAFGTMPKKRSK